MNGRSSARGFTLIELLVVMTIIAVLLSIAVPRYFHTLDRFCGPLNGHLEPAGRYRAPRCPAASESDQY